MNQKSDGKSSKFGEKLMKKSSKSRSGGGLGRSWSDFGALGRGLAAFGLENLEKTQKKGEKRDLFGGFLGAFGALGRPSGGPGGHLGCILGVLESILGASGTILGRFWGHFGSWAEYQKTLKNLRFLKVF